MSFSLSLQSARRRLANFQRVSSCRWGYVPLTLAIWSHKLDGLIIARWPLKVGFTVGIDVPLSAGDFRAATPIMRTVGHCVRPFGTVDTLATARAIFTSSSKANATARPDQGAEQELAKSVQQFSRLIMRRINITTKINCTLCTKCGKLDEPRPALPARVPVPYSPCSQFHGLRPVVWLIECSCRCKCGRILIVCVWDQNESVIS